MPTQGETKVLADRVDAVEGRLITLRKETVGDRNDKKNFPDSLAGQVDDVRDGLDEAIEELDDIKKVITGWQSTWNRVQSTFWVAVIVAVAGFIVGRVVGSN